ncbi:MAG: hypothetical protein COV60_03145 [Candidatus Magasanikbacteria bacterium CG11_big_fil_rev_8_21_14_0_20_43_7]|uniref:Uncharacterized protein n=1 Tax=Candidatus Magasanikbacteria bacterium CG11_big_fil_rev_8_21_14_0_20_43_7 TaxID=1974654 RepID=A0A2H0N211_9BACT|nr:MAG: hypothetical protein COV60_03145 [Candidatus Magasanikbacteria bacterium CG11_big_fil_rev_8_21_14_0_20_43_7]
MITLFFGYTEILEVMISGWTETSYQLFHSHSLACTAFIFGRVKLWQEYITKGGDLSRCHCDFVKAK